MTDKNNTDNSPATSMVALVVKMAQRELPKESPTFTKLPNFRHVGPPSPTSLNIPSISATRRSSFGLSSLFASPLTKRKSFSPSQSGESSPRGPYKKETLPGESGGDTSKLSDDIRSRIHELSETTKERKKHKEPDRARPNTLQIASNFRTDSQRRKSGEHHQYQQGDLSNKSSLRGSDHHLNGSGSQDNQSNGYSSYGLPRSGSMGSKDGNENKRMNKTGNTQSIRRKGIGSNVDENAMFKNVTIVHIEEEGALNTYELEYLRCSADGDLVGLKKIFEEQTYYLFHFDVNCVDSLDRTALSLALLNRHLDIVQFILSDEVVGIELRDALFYAIQCEFYEAIELVLDRDAQTSIQIQPGTTSPFEPGLTPFMLAANKNNYRILAMLYKSNHRLTFTDEVVDDSIDTFSWDAVMERLLHFRARASPAFMLLMYNEKGMVWDPLNTSMDLFGELQGLAKREREVDEAYLQMAAQCETFALQLLQEVRSASELADLMRYDLDADPDVEDDPGETDRIILRGREKIKNYLRPIEKAVKYKMKDFVTSDNAQLALIYIQKGSMFRKLRGYKATMVQVLLGIFFPILSLAFIIAPNSKFGRLMKNPTVKFCCAVASEMTFVFMLLANTIKTQYETAMTAGEIPLLLIIAYFWILGKFAQEVREIHNQGIKEYVTDVWNWNDMFTILLFTGYIILRLVNSVAKSDDERAYWQNTVLDPVPLSDICISIAYILIHLRILELLRADRRFGPLQATWATDKASKNEGTTES